jgi:8-oxo-dGTP pyrophosphatase MutT (NUDIX family)
MNKHEKFSENLKGYFDKNDFPNKAELEQFIISGEDLYSRKNQWGHLTGSAWIVNQDMTRVLLILHGKYKTWVAPGGHVDEGEIPFEAAVRETAEEVGVSKLLAKTYIFDLDVHPIPYSAKKDEPAHWHADLRFLMFGSNSMEINLDTNECDDVRWFEIADLLKSEDHNLRRMAQKTVDYKKALDLISI